MRVAALSDVHGNLAALDAVLADVVEAGVDTVVFTGDVALGPFPDATLERLMELGLPARFVRGNCDRELVAAFDATPVEASLHDASWEAARCLGERAACRASSAIFSRGSSRVSR